MTMQFMKCVHVHERFLDVIVVDECFKKHDLVCKVRTCGWMTIVRFDMSRKEGVEGADAEQADGAGDEESDADSWLASDDEEAVQPEVATYLQGGLHVTDRKSPLSLATRIYISPYMTCSISFIHLMAHVVIRVYGDICMLQINLSMWCLCRDPPPGRRQQLRSVYFRTSSSKRLSWRA